MDEHLDSNHTEEQPGGLLGANRWLAVAVVALLVVAGVAFGYGYRQQIMVSHMTAQQAMSNATINDMQGQVSTLTAKLNDIQTQQAQAAAAAAQQKAEAAKTTKNGAKGAGKKTATESKRIKELQARLDDQQKQLQATQDEVAKNRTDLEGSLNSTKDELNGSIARTHEELVALAKRGERSYFEFDLTKSKQFQRVGPITMALRKADTKHKNYNLEMVVDDNKLTKKNVNLYEPIWIHTESEGQPVQVVVNRVEKDKVHGYVSAPKYKASELAAGANSASTVTPVSAHPEPQPPQSPEQNPPVPQSPDQNPPTPPIPQPPQ